ncbi:MAG: tetratricopeptide repeat-containing sensor histidine kinase [Cyclobacteriaceae bacterium]|nr:tetratricopeptide repeat-containing sensor histidine kinase [Cyclobacteriaceae bacterium]
MNQRLIILTLLLSVLRLDCLADKGSIEQLEQRLVNANDTARITILNDLARNYSSSDLNRAEDLAMEAYALLGKINYPKQKITNYNLLSFIKGSLGKYDLALAYSDTALSLSESKDRHLLAKSYDARFSLFFMKGDYALAQEAAEKSNAYAIEENDSSLMAKTYDNLGIIKGLKGAHAEAIDYFMKSLQLYESLQDAENIGFALIHIGHTLELAGNFNKAQEYLTKALHQNRMTKNRYNEAWSLLNLGVVYSRKNELDSALLLYEQTLQIAEEINNQRLILTCLDNIGGKYTLMGDFEKSNYYLQKAYKLSESSGQNSRTVYIIGNLAENYLFMGQYDSARFFGERQLELALTSDLISEQKVAYYNLAQIYDSLGSHEQAYHSLLKYIALNDTIFSHQKSEQIESLRETFEAERKEQEIENLKSINEKVRYRNISFAGAAISFLILGGLLYYVQRLKVRRNRLLLEKEKEMDRMKSRFFANISHEFRTPLTLILGPLDDLISTADLPDTRKKLTVMQRNAGRLLELVNQLLDLSRIESGNLRLTVTRSDIIHVIKGVAMSFHSFAEQKNIHLVLDVFPDDLEMNYDRAKIETILTNLLSNAFKFTREHGKITVSSTISKGQGKLAGSEFLSVVVADDGQGIPAAEVQFIFDRFYQSETNQLLQHEGSGIGLALTKELVELHGGSIKAESRLGEGTKITIELPIDLPLQDGQVTIFEASTSEKMIEIHDEIEQTDDAIGERDGRSHDSIGHRRP